MLNEKKVVPKLRQEVAMKVDIVTSDDIKIYHTGKFQDFTARYIIKRNSHCFNYITAVDCYYPAGSVFTIPFSRTFFVDFSKI